MFQSVPAINGAVWNDGTRPYKEFYHRTTNKNVDEIEFKRFTDLPDGGLPETFIARRK